MADIGIGIKEFPIMLYNKSGDTRIANTRMELQDFIMAGWSKSRTGLSEEELLVLKVAQVEEELADLKHKLEIMRGGVDDDGEDTTQPPAPVSTPTNQLATPHAVNKVISKPALSTVTKSA